MKKFSLLLPVMAFVLHASVFARGVDSDPLRPARLNCAEAPFLTVLNPTCESPLTGTITVTEPQQPEFEYSIDGVHYQPDPFFADIVPGTYQVTYRNTLTGCVSDPNEAIVTDSLLIATLTLQPDSGTAFQNVCINNPMLAIQYAVGGTASEASVSGLPAGVGFSCTNGMLVIAGTPTAAGVFNYTVTSNGACPAVVVGTLVVKLNVALVWMSSSGSRNQSFCGSAAITPIKYILANGATAAVASGLPTGVSGNLVSGIYTLSGTAAQAGVYNYTVTTVGGCSQATSSGTIVVSQPINVGLTCSQDAAAGSVSLSWDAVPGAATYSYSYAVNNGNWISGIASGTNHATISGLDAGASVAFSVNAIDGVDCFSPQTVNCVAQALSTSAFGKGRFSYYPNPVTDVLQLESVSLVTQLKIFTLTGQLMHQARPDAANSQIDLSFLAAGVYLMRLEDAESSETFPLVKR